MKTSVKLLSLSAAALMSAATATSVFAEAESLELGVGAIYTVYDQDYSLQDNNGYRGFAGARLGEHFGVEFTFDQVNTETDPALADVTMQSYYFSGLYHFNVDSNIQPYLSLGFGETSWNTEGFPAAEVQSTTANLGTGIKWYVSDSFMVRPAVNYFHNTEFDEDYVTAGLSVAWVFGGDYGRVSKPKPAPVKKAKDSDKDGVADAYDSCANTPKGVSVDGKGCPLDSDGDGVADYQDKCLGTVAKLKVDEKGCPIKLSETVSIDLKVNFDSNSAEVKPAYYSEIRKVSEFLEQYEGTSVVIEGHTDTSGSAAYNKSLSQRRADAVAAVLVNELGIASSRVTAMGYGEEQPIADESTAAGREANRRVVAKVSVTVESMEEK